MHTYAKESQVMLQAARVKDMVLASELGFVPSRLHPHPRLLAHRAVQGHGPAEPVQMSTRCDGWRRCSCLFMAKEQTMVMQAARFKYMPEEILCLRLASGLGGGRDQSRLVGPSARMESSCE